MTPHDLKVIVTAWCPRCGAARGSGHPFIDLDVDSVRGGWRFGTTLGLGSWLADDFQLDTTVFIPPGSLWRRDRDGIVLVAEGIR